MTGSLRSPRPGTDTLGRPWKVPAPLHLDLGQQPPDGEGTARSQPAAHPLLCHHPHVWHLESWLVTGPHTASGPSFFLLSSADLIPITPLLPVDEVRRKPSTFLLPRRHACSGSSLFLQRLVHVLPFLSSPLSPRAYTASTPGAPGAGTEDEEPSLRACGESPRLEGGRASPARSGDRSRAGCHGPASNPQGAFSSLPARCPLCSHLGGQVHVPVCVALSPRAD